LVRQDTDKCDSKSETIDIIESLTEDPALPISRFHSTLLMNWISCDELSVRFAGTLIRQGEVSPYGYGPFAMVPNWRKKYISRGFVVTNMGGLSMALPLIYWGTNQPFPVTLSWSEFLDGIDLYGSSNALCVSIIPEINN
ncbi:hypothetical protein FRB99_001348, partial [Tulasnella sp. 403]